MLIEVVLSVTDRPAVETKDLSLPVIRPGPRTGPQEVAGISEVDEAMVVEVGPKAFNKLLLLPIPKTFGLR